MTDLVKHLRSTRANMIGTDDEQHYFDCHEAADYIEARESVIATLENRLNLLAVDRDRIERLKGLCGRAAITIRFANVQQHLCGECRSIGINDAVELLAELREASK